MRAALLPAGGDPFVNAYWMRHYAQLWADEVDELRIMVCGQNDPGVRAYLQELASHTPNCRIDFLSGRTDHGAVMRMLLDSTEADEVVFLEDDAFVRNHDVIGSRFRAIEDDEIDVIGTARSNADPPLLARATERFGPDPITQTGETGLSLYPCFLFARKSDLLRTEGNFSARFFHAGDYILGLDWRSPDEWTDNGGGKHTDSGADTFTATSWELRSLGLRIQAEAAWRSDWAHRSVDPSTPWFHVGSLSSGYGGAFMSGADPESYAGLVKSIAPKPGQVGEGELRDWHKRFSWWTRVWDCWDGGIPDFHREYGEHLTKFMRDVQADPAKVAEWRAGYDPLITWQEKP